MNKERTWRPPVPLVALDAIGTVLLGLGLAERLAATGLVPESLRFQNYDLAMIVVGGLLMVPLLFNLLEHVRSPARN